jgi:hypothetical protein
VLAVSPGIGINLGDWTNSTRLGWLTAAALTTAGLGILVAHYRLRRPWAAAGAGVALVLLTLLLPTPNRAEPAPVELAALLAPPLRPTQGLWSSKMATSSRGTSVFLSGRLALPSLPPDVSAAVFVDRVSVRADGREHALGGYQQCCLGRGPVAAALSRPATANDGEGWSEGLAFVRASALDTLLAKPVTLEADATVVFQRHRLVASLPLAPGAAFAGDGSVVEILAVQPREPAVMEVRIARFPRLRRDAHPQLAFFVSDANRQHVLKTSRPFVTSVQPAARPVRQAVQGRRWSGRYRVPLPIGYGIGDERRLLIVESRSVGEASARILADGAPIAGARPEPH